MKKGGEIVERIVLRRCHGSRGFDSLVRFAGKAYANLVELHAQLWKLASLIEGGGVVVPHFDGAGPIVRTSVAPSLICP